MHVILSNGFAGSERSTAESCNSQVQLGHEVTLVVRRSHRANGASIRDHVLPQVCIEEVSDRLFTGRQLRRIVAAAQPQILHAHLRRATRVVARLASNARKVSTLHLHINGPHFLDMDALVCISRWQLATVPAEFRGKAVFIPNSLLPTPRLTGPEIEHIREQLGVGPGDYLIGGVGRLAHSKGWDILIRAFAAAQLSKAKLVLVGEGRERRRLMRLAGDNVAFLGFRSDVKQLYQAFDLFVCPSRREPMGRVILEALDAGVPVIASAADGPREILAEYPGDLVPIGDVDALCSALRRNYELGRCRVEVDLTPHHLDVVSRELVSLYEMLLRP